MRPSPNHTFAPGLGRARPSHHPEGQTPITVENAVFPHAAAALYPLEIENLTLSGKEGFFLYLALSLRVNLCFPICHARIPCLFANQTLVFDWSI